MFSVVQQNHATNTHIQFNLLILKSRVEMNDDSATVARAADNSKRLGRRVNVNNFATGAIKESYDAYFAKAQDNFLKGEFTAASAYASRAARIYPTAHIFGLLAAIQEGLGHFERSSDFRLLQAFLAKDVTLWEELLGDFLQQQAFFKAAVCLQRLSSLEHADAARYRSLQIQLADLLVGLGEIKRASTILINLWQSSRYRDFEVFASLASMFFQLGRWSALNQLIKESLDHGFRKKHRRIAAPVSVENEPHDDDEGGATPSPSEGPLTSGGGSSKRARTSKRVTFMETLMTAAAAEGTIHDEEQSSPRLSTATPVASSPTQRSGGDAAEAPPAGGADEFDFDAAAPPAGSLERHTSHQSSEHHSTSCSTSTDDDIDVSTSSAKKNYLTLVNVHAELLNEQGKFEKTITVVQRCAAQLDVALLELPPDVLLRYGVALSFLGGTASDVACTDVFEHLLMTSPLDTYGDALYDAAVSLESTGRREAALRIFETLRRYQKFVAENEGLAVSDDDDDNLGDGGGGLHMGARLDSLRDQADRRREQDERRASRLAVKTTEAALTFHIGKCYAGMGKESDAYTEFKRVLELNPAHAESRVELSRIYMALGDLSSACAAVELRDSDDPYQSTLLSAQLLPVLKAQGRLLEAIGVGVALFQLFLANHDDEGDKLSTVSGTSSRRRGRGTGGSSASSLYSMPSLTRATSSLVPASALSDAMGFGAGGPGSIASAAASFSGGSRSYGLLSNRDAIAATFHSTASPMSMVSISKRGSMTSTYAGSVAAASSVAGSGGQSNASGVWSKDASQLFAFNWRRKSSTTGKAAGSNPLWKSGAARLRHERQEASRIRMQEYTQRLREEGCEGGAPAMAVDGGSVGNVEELEEMERMLADEEAALLSRGGHEEVDDDAGTHNKRGGRRTESSQPLQSPSESEVVDVPRDLSLVASQTFDDPQMAALFLECTGGVRQSNVRGGGDGGTAPPPPPTTPPNAHDILRLLGRNQLISLAVEVVGCYSMLERYVEAKEFGRIVLIRWGQLHKRGRSGGNYAIAHKLRLALLKCSLASGNTDDAGSTALQLLADGEGGDDGNDWGRDCWAVLSTLSSSTNDAKALSPLVIRSLLARCMNESNHSTLRTQLPHTAVSALGREIPLSTLYEHRAITVPGLCWLANNAMGAGAVRPALNTYLLALSMRPTCPFLNMMVGVSYCCAASQRTSGCLHDLVSSGLHYVQEYRRLALLELDDADGGGDVEVSEVDAAWYQALGSAPRGATDATMSPPVGLTFSSRAPRRLHSHHDDGGDDITHRHARRLEIQYNVARVLHYLSLHYLCAPMYEEIVTSGKALLQAEGRRRAKEVGGGFDTIGTSTMCFAKMGALLPSTPHDAATAATSWQSTATPIDIVRMLVQCASINVYVIYAMVSQNVPLAVSWLPEL